MDREASRKVTTIILLLLAFAAVWYAKNFQRERINIISPTQQEEGENSPAEQTPEEDPFAGEDETEHEDEGEDEEAAVPTVTDPDTALENYEAFFAEYRMQRDRIRASEVEMLNHMIENPNITAEGKKEAEAQLLSMIEVMEKELLVENMIKAQGLKDAVFFMKDGKANVVGKAAKLNQTEFMQIAEMVSTVTGVSFDNIAVVEHGGS